MAITRTVAEQVDVIHCPVNLRPRQLRKRDEDVLTIAALRSGGEELVAVLLVLANEQHPRGFAPADDAVDPLSSKAQAWSEKQPGTGRRPVRAYGEPLETNTQKRTPKDEHFGDLRCVDGRPGLRRGDRPHCLQLARLARLVARSSDSNTRSR
jgi:hypothetical protein